MNELYSVTRGVAVITLSSAPVNALKVSVRRSVASHLLKAGEDPGVHAIVLIGDGAHFCAGADIQELGSQAVDEEPVVPKLISMIESSSKPVIAALHGACMGGGLELALGCHYRIASAGARMALPEVFLGLMPGAGGTQRLPRLLGVEVALNMIIFGRTLRSEACMQIPQQRLLDRLTPSRESLLEEALEFACGSTVRDGGLPLARKIPCTHHQSDGYFQFVKNMLGAKEKASPAIHGIIQAIQAATRRSVDEGLSIERDIFKQLLGTPESIALRHLFLAERAAGKIAVQNAAISLRNIRTVGVVGAGTMGTGISISMLNAGYPVKLLESSQAALDRGVGRIQHYLKSQVAKGRLTDVQAQECLSLLQPTLAYAAIGDCDLVIEAVYEDMDVKRQVYAQLNPVMKTGAILASNTSTLDVERLAQSFSRPKDFIGLHFFSPANVMKLLEVVCGEETSPEVLATVLKLAGKIGKTAVVSGVCDGFIGNRMFEQYLLQAEFLLEEGASPEQIDKAVENFGFAMGPFRVLDLAGGDINWAVRKRRKAEQPTLTYSPIAERLCEMGRFGQKVGAGWYDYSAGSRRGVKSELVHKLIDAERETLGIAPRRVSDEEIVQRLVLALANEGARILEDGIASRSSDIDVVYVTGYGFPNFRGGPMHYASQQGVQRVVEQMNAFARHPRDATAFWNAASLRRELLASGATA